MEPVVEPPVLDGHGGYDWHQLMPPFVPGHQVLLCAVQSACVCGQLDVVPPPPQDVVLDTHAPLHIYWPEGHSTGHVHDWHQLLPYELEHQYIDLATQSDCVVGVALVVPPVLEGHGGYWHHPQESPVP